MMSFPRAAVSLLTALPLITNAFSLTAYDFGFYGIAPRNHYVSTDLTSPHINLLQYDERCEDGAYVLITLNGNFVDKARPVMLDNRGNMIWTDPSFGTVTNLQVQQYHGKDYLTFWTETAKWQSGDHSNGTYVLLDSSYEIAHRVSAVGAAVAGDIHEFKITSNNTALISIYQDYEIDCARLDISSSSKCWINDCLFQEIDIQTGSLVFEWRASDHIRISDSVKPRGSAGKSKDKSYDYFHLNSVDKDPAGNYYISSRHMSAIFCISPTGRIVWSWGGRNNNFTDLSSGRATDFAWQHHANWHANNTFTLFDNNGNNVFHNPSKYSRGIMASLDLEGMTAQLLHEYVHPDHILAVSQGSTQYLEESGNVFVGWGNSPAFTQFSEDGEVLCNAHYGAGLFFEFIDFGWVKSYRSFKGRWIGKPTTTPDIKIRGDEVFVSWNGATEVAAWRLQTANSPDLHDDIIEDIDELPKEGFESAFLLADTVGNVVRVAAVDGTGSILGYSAWIDSSPQPTSISLQALIFGCAIFVAGGAVGGFFVFQHRKLIWRKLSELLNPRKASEQEYELLENAYD